MSERQAASSRPAELVPQGKLLNGRYRCLEQLGAGGMGVVYRAYDAVQQREVALKQLRAADLSAQRRALVEALFAREYHTLVRLRHPRIIEVHEYGRSDDGPFYTMELSGHDLQTLAPLPYRELCQHLRDVASSLALLHAHGLAHRDVSPRNIRRTADGRTKLIDFGALAPFGVNTDVVGTPICIAPEVLHRMPIDQRADLYALGVVAYMALTGRPPYPARRLDDLAEAWKSAPAPASKYASDVPPALDALISSLLSVNVLARPSSVVLQRAQAKSGYLYVLHGDELQLVASSSPEEAPLGLETQLRESTRLLRQQSTSTPANDGDEVETALVEVVAAQALPAEDFSILMLASHRQYPPTIVGGLILQQGKPAALEASFLEELASALSNRAAVSTAF